MLVISAGWLAHYCVIAYHIVRLYRNRCASTWLALTRRNAEAISGHYGKLLLKRIGRPAEPRTPARPARPPALIKDLEELMMCDDKQCAEQMINLLSARCIVVMRL